MSKTRFIQVESKNAILELLKEGRDFDKLYIAANSFKDEKVQEIVEIAGKKNIPVLKVSRKIITRRLRNSKSESILGYMYSQNNWDLEELLDKLSDEGKQPFFLVLDDLKYTQNIAAIMRTAFAAGVNGIIVNPQEKNLITNETIRISMGAAERIPLVETNLFNALKLLTKNDIKIFAVHMGGDMYFDTDLTGAAAFIMGAEDVGITAGLLERVDKKISIPMREGIGSLNVSASAAVVMYEKLRQEVTA